MNKPELLAPIGNYECLEAVINHGADAVYAGIGQFNLRARSSNFTPEEILDVIQFVHGRNKKIYIVLNTMPTDNQLPEIENYISKLSQKRSLPNAFIVSDPGIICLCKKYLKSPILHLSTQTGTFNRYSMEFWVSQGIRRIVLPRELNLNQIREISKIGICETEIFIHGAMCVSISGRCLLGAYLAERHPNQGDCPQPCRYTYDISVITDSTGKSKEWFTAEEDSRGVYLFNSRDLNTLSILPEIIESGVSSLKIEGRNKSVHYVSSVVKIYRAAIDRYFKNPENFVPDDIWFDELNALDHRPYTTGFYKDDYRMQEYSISKEQSKVRLVGMVKAILKEGSAVIDVKNPFSAHEKLHIFPVCKKVDQYDIEFSELKDLNGNILNRALTNHLVKIDPKYNLSIGDIVRRNI